MTNLEKFNKIIFVTFSLNSEEIKDEYGPNEIGRWDSLGHFDLISSLEEKFDISLPIDDVSRMYTIGDIKNVLKKYGVEIWTL